MPQETLLVYCTCPDTSSAEQLAHYLVSNQLAACINIVPSVQSIYQWQGRVHYDYESQLQIKTSSEHYQVLAQHIKAQHPYELPEIIAVPISQGQPDYLAWIHDCLVKKS